jgi:hypothetical protein
MGVVLWTLLRVSFNAYVFDPLYESQVIYWALTQQLTIG